MLKYSAFGLNNFTQVFDPRLRDSDLGFDARQQRKYRGQIQPKCTKSRSGI